MSNNSWRNSKTKFAKFCSNKYPMSKPQSRLWFFLFSLYELLMSLRISNYWMRLSRIWSILQIEVRPRWITPSEICRILHILRSSNSIIVLLFLQNNSKFKNKLKHANLGRCKFISMMHLLSESLGDYKVCLGLQICYLFGKTYKPAQSSATLESLKSTHSTKLLKKLLMWAAHTLRWRLGQG